jgi:hypothetical protein
MTAHQFREDGSHYNGGAEFFGYGYLAIGEPRLKLIRRWYRKGKRKGQTEDRYFVDGAHVEGYSAALEALKTPPTFTADEIAALEQIGDEPADHRKVLDLHALHYLRAKGAIEWGPPGRCKRTDVGRSALAEMGRAESGSINHEADGGS